MGETPPWADNPLGRQSLPPHTSDIKGYGQQADGTHPTGMHTCFNITPEKVNSKFKTKKMQTGSGQNSGKRMKEDRFPYKCLILQCSLCPL